MSRKPVALACPCGLRAGYAECCGRFHRGRAALTAELLMRSRFSAFAFGDAGYLLRTWDPATSPGVIDLDPSIHWKRLAVIAVSDTTVEFTATYVAGGQPGTLRELSVFRRLEGSWFYVGPLG